MLLGTLHRAPMATMNPPLTTRLVRRGLFDQVHNEDVTPQEAPLLASADGAGDHEYDYTDADRAAYDEEPDAVG